MKHPAAIRAARRTNTSRFSAQSDTVDEKISPRVRALMRLDQPFHTVAVIPKNAEGQVQLLHYFADHKVRPEQADRDADYEIVRVSSERITDIARQNYVRTIRTNSEQRRDPISGRMSQTAYHEPSGPFDDDY